MSLTNQRIRRTENTVYRHLAAQRGVNRTAGAHILEQRNEGLRAATRHIPRITIPVAEYAVAQSPGEAALFHAANAALVIERAAGRALKYNIEDAIAHASTAARYVGSHAAEGLRTQYATKKGLKEVAKFGALGALGTLGIW